jgi:hypothetical protein
MRGRMRPRAVVVAATLTAAWLIGASPGLAGSVSNSTGSNTTAQVVWGSGDETGAGHYGGIYGDVESHGTIVGLWENDVVVLTCDNGTPADPSDDWQGFAGTMRNGFGEGTVSIAPNLGWASVSGLLRLETVIFNNCTNDYVTTNVETDVPVTLELVATTTSDNSFTKMHELLASQYNIHQNVHMVSRYATGTALLGGEPYAFDSGLISRNHWTDHMKTR